MLLKLCEPYRGRMKSGENMGTELHNNISLGEADENNSGEEAAVTIFMDTRMVAASEL